MRFGFLSFLIWAACSSTVDDATGGGTVSSSSSATVGGASPCATPEGDRICLGPNSCDIECDAVDGLCFESGVGPFAGDPDGEGIGYCKPNADDLTLPLGCEDGKLLIWSYGKEPYLPICAPEGIGELYCDAGRGDLVYFTDFGSYDCAPLPEPQDCPAVEGITLCGDACGPCKADEVCRGRSRLHPYGMCLVNIPNTCHRESPMCDASERCFIYTVDAKAQFLANYFGVCLPAAKCDAAAAELPGGGECL